MKHYDVAFCTGREELKSQIEAINTQGQTIESITSEQFQYITIYTVVYSTPEKRRKA